MVDCSLLFFTSVEVILLEHYSLFWVGNDTHVGYSWKTELSFKAEQNQNFLWSATVSRYNRNPNKDPSDLWLTLEVEV